MPFDAMGNYTGGYMLTPQETEEERRRRLGLEQESVPVKQTITTDPRTGQQRMKIEGSVRDLSAANPLTPTVSTAPVSPEMVGIRQVESGNRDFDAQGRPVTSPAGAMYASQVMPATARDPGFGVRPAQAQTADEYNRVGQDYFNAMLQRYGGNREQALAAYNAGPGRVDRNLAANQGQLNVGQLPRETQGYIPRALNAISNAVFPSAQAATLPAGPTGPTAPTAPATAPAGPTVAATTPTTTAPGTAQTVNYDDLLTQSLTNSDVRQRLILDPGTPPAYRRAAFANERTALEEEQKRKDAERRAQQIIQTGDGREFAKAMKEEGSLLKAIFFGYSGAQDLARNELNKMGYGGKWETAMDEKGQRALIKYRNDGMPMEGFNEAGAPLTTEQLAAFGVGGMGGNLDVVGGTYVNDVTGEVGRVVTDKRTGRSFVQTNAGLKPLTGFRPQSSMGSLTDQRARMIQEINLKLVGKSAEEAMAILRPYNQALAGQGLPIIQPTEVGIQAPQIGVGTAAPAAPTATTGGAVAPSGTAAPAGGAPVTGGATGPVVPGGPRPNITATTPQLNPVVGTTGGAGPGGRPTMTQIEAGAVGAKEEAKVVGEDVGKIKANFGTIKDNIDDFENLQRQMIEHPGYSVSVGASAQPGFQFIPGSDKASFYALFKRAQGSAFLTAIEKLKGTGAISDREGEAATKAVTALDLAQNEREFRRSLHELTSMMRRYGDRAAKKIGQQPLYNEPTMTEQARENRQAESWLKSARPGGKNPDGSIITQDQIDAVRNKLFQRGAID
jgi:soluble lytic murein transglycosylase